MQTTKSKVKTERNKSDQYYTIVQIAEAFDVIGSYAKAPTGFESDAPDERAFALLSDGEHLQYGVRAYLNSQKGVSGARNGSDEPWGLITPEFVSKNGEPCYSVDCIARFASWLSVQVVAKTPLKYGPEQLLWDVRRIQVLFLVWYRFDEDARDDGRHILPADTVEQAN